MYAFIVLFIFSYSEVYAVQIEVFLKPQQQNIKDITVFSQFTPAEKKIAQIIEEGNLKQLIQFLNEEGGDPNMKISSMSLLHIAAFFGSAGILGPIIQKNKSIEKDTTEWIPENFKIELRRRVVETLIKAGADVNAKDKYFSTPLHHAVSSNNLHVIKALVKAGANWYSINSIGSTPIAIAFQKEHKGVIEFFYQYERFIQAIKVDNEQEIIDLIKLGLNPNMKIEGTRCLHYVISKGRIKAVKALIEAGADVNLTDGKVSPIHVASRLGDTEILKVLIDAGAYTNASTRFNRSALYIAIKHGEEKAAELLSKYNQLYEAIYRKDIKEVHNLIKNEGLNVNARYAEGMTPLHMAAIALDKDIFAFLVQEGANVNSTDKNGWTALYLLSISPSKESLEFINFLKNYFNSKKLNESILNLLTIYEEKAQEKTLLPFEKDRSISCRANFL